MACRFVGQRLNPFRLLCRTSLWCSHDERLPESLTGSCIRSGRFTSWCAIANAFCWHADCNSGDCVRGHKLMNLLHGSHENLDGKSQTGFTLAEVIVATAIFGIVIQGIIFGYVMSSRRAEWSAHSLAAQSLASQGVEQARAAQWLPQEWPAVDDLPPTNIIQVDVLDIPFKGAPKFATNYISVTAVSTNPAVRQIRADCVWQFVSGALFTNTVVTLRAPDQ